MRPLLAINILFFLSNLQHGFCQTNSLFKDEVVNESSFQNRLNKERESKEVKKMRLMKSNMRALKGMDNISFNIFDSTTYSPRGNWSYTNESGYDVWAGVQSGDMNNYSLIIQKDGRMTGQIVVNNKFFMIEHVKDDIHILKEIDMKKLTGVGCATTPTLPDSVKIESKEDNKETQTGGRVKSNNTGRVSSLTTNSTPYPVCANITNEFLPNLSNNTYRVGFAYTPQYAAIFSTNTNAMLDEINYYVEQMNYTYANSLIDLRAVLAFAYQTPENETISFDVNYGNFTHSQGLINDPTGKYDEFFAYQFTHKADIGILLISATDDLTAGGRANVGTKMALSTRNSAFNGMTVAHEVGHLFGCEHNREEFNGVERLFLDGKKAYGYLNNVWSWRTVMSYGSVPRLPFYSDWEMYYNGHLRGNEYANAADYIRGDHNSVTSYLNNVTTEGYSGNIPSGQIANIYGLNTVEISNSVISPNSRVQAHASQTVTLKPGFHAINGSLFQAYISSYDTPPTPNILPQVPAQPAAIRYIQGEYTCRGDVADFCIYSVPNATHYVWTASNTGITVTSSFNGRAVRLRIGSNANWTGYHSISVTANNIYGASTQQIFSFGLTQNQCGSGPPPQPRIASNDESTEPQLLADHMDYLDVYPNPSNKSFNIRYTLKESGATAIDLFDITGKMISQILDDNSQSAGQHELTYTMVGSPGIYIISYQTRTSSIRKKIIIK